MKLIECAHAPRTHRHGMHRTQRFSVLIMIYVLDDLSSFEYVKTLPIILLQIEI
jgi:hypothetical protein